MTQRFSVGDRVRRKNVPARPTQEEIIRSSTKLVQTGSREPDYREIGTVLGYNQQSKSYILKMDGAGNNLAVKEEDLEKLLHQ